MGSPKSSRRTPRSSPILAKTPKHFAPPILRNTATGFELSQTPAILEYLGEKFGLVPHSLEDKARARQVALSACDFLADGRAPFHPVKPTESYAIQKDEAAVAVAEFTAEGGRLDRWLAHFATLVDNKPRYLFGDTITYADCALFHVLDAAMSQFPDAWDEPSREKLARRSAAHEAHHDARDARRLPQGRRPRALGRRLDDVGTHAGRISTPPAVVVGRGVVVDAREALGQGPRYRGHGRPPRVDAPESASSDGVTSARTTKASKSTAHVSRNAAWFNMVVVEKNKPENATAMITAADEMTVPVRAAASTHASRSDNRPTKRYSWTLARKKMS